MEAGRKATLILLDWKPETQTRDASNLSAVSWSRQVSLLHRHLHGLAGRLSELILFIIQQPR